MPSIEEMLIEIDASTKGLRREMGKANKALVNFERRTNRSTRNVEKSFTRLGTTFARRVLPVLGGATFAAAVQNAISDLSALSDTADKLGISVERLQELRFAAQEVGVQTSALDVGMQRFIRRVAEAQQGTGELKGVLEQYNIAVRDSSGRTRDVMDVLKDLADVVANTEDSQEQLRIAFKAFDTEGAALVNVLKKGADGLDEFARRANDLGVVIDDELVRKADEFDKAWDRALLVATSNFKVFALSAATEIQSIFQLLTDANTSFAQKMQALKQRALPQGPQLTVQDLSSIPSLPGSGINSFQTDLLRQMAQVSQRVQQQIEEEAKKVPIPKKKPTDVITRGLDAQDAAIQKFQDEQKAILNLIAALEFRNEQLQRGTREQDLHNQLKQAGVSLESEHGQHIADLVNKYHDMTEAQDQSLKQAENLKSAVDELGFAFTSAFEDAVLSGNGLRDVLGGILKDLAKIVLRQTVTKPLGGLVSSFTSNLFGFADGGVMTGQGPVPLRKYASGGVASSPQLALFGEGSTPEAYVPLPDGKSIPVTINNQDGGPTINQSITIDARGADDSVIPRLNQFKEEIKNETLQAVVASANRGGSFAKAVGRRK